MVLTKTLLLKHTITADKGMIVIDRGGTNRVFGKPCFCPLQKRGRFDENGENDESAFYPLKTRASLLGPPKTTKMTQMPGVTQAKAWFRNSRFVLDCNRAFLPRISLRSSMGSGEPRMQRQFDPEIAKSTLAK